MPRVDSDQVKCVVYLYPSKADAAEGKKWGGTGFIVGLLSSGKAFYYAITNKHVIKEHRAKFIRINAKDPEQIHCIIEGEWTFHKDGKGDDLAACPLELSTTIHDFKSLNRMEFVDRQVIRELQIGLGEDLFMVGRFLEHDGGKRNLPTVRFGTIGMMPDAPIIDDGYEQESFLAEIRTIPGYSGSPVFVHIPENRLTVPGVVASGSDRRWALKNHFIDRFIGVEWCRLKGEVSQKYLNGMGYNVHVTSGMSGVIPSWKVAELLDCAKFQIQREDNSMQKTDSAIEHTGAKPDKAKRKNRDIEIPPISRKKFFGALDKATQKRKPS